MRQCSDWWHKRYLSKRDCVERRIRHHHIKYCNKQSVSRNRIGVNTAGAARGNTNAGIAIQGPGNTIGGVNATYANIIAGNPQGIVLSGSSATNNVISFNTIGTDTAANTGRGIHITGGASTNTIGPKNTIRRNDTGLRIDDGSIANRITQNSIAENINLGIDLTPSAGVTANDAGDADNGGNRLQNFPQMSGNPLLIGNDLEVSFSVNSSPVHAAYPLTIEFFVSDGGGEGGKFLGSTLSNRIQLRCWSKNSEPLRVQNRAHRWNY